MYYISSINWFWFFLISQKLYFYLPNTIIFDLSPCNNNIYYYKCKWIFPTHLSLVLCFKNEPWQYFNSVNDDEALLRSFIEWWWLSLMFTFVTCSKNWPNSNMVRLACIWYFNGFEVFGPTPASSTIWTSREKRPKYYPR